MSGRSAPDAARRALGLCAVAARAYLEEGAGDAHAESIRVQLTSFVAAVGLEHVRRAREALASALDVAADPAVDPRVRELVQRRLDGLDALERDRDAER